MSNNLLKGKRGIVFGALNDMSIAWKVAERAVEEGAIITLSNTPLAVRMGTTNDLAEKLNAKLIPADATSAVDFRAWDAEVGYGASTSKTAEEYTGLIPLSQQIIHIHRENGILQRPFHPLRSQNCGIFLTVSQQKGKLRTIYVRSQ